MMNKETKRNLQMIDHLKYPNGIIYEVLKRKKRSVVSELWNTLFSSIPEVFDTMSNIQGIYLLASENEGKIVEIKKGKIQNTLKIPNWTPDQKENFKKVVIDSYVYRKIRRL